jgi:hypothetical protein
MHVIAPGEEQELRIWKIGSPQVPGACAAAQLLAGVVAASLAAAFRVVAPQACPRTFLA